MDVVLGRLTSRRRRRLGALPLALLRAPVPDQAVARSRLLHLRLHRALAAAHSAPLPIRSLCFPHLVQAGVLTALPAGGPRGRLPLPGIAAGPRARPRQVGHRRPLPRPAATRHRPGQPEQPGTGAGAGAAERLQEGAVQRAELEAGSGGGAHQQAGHVVAVHGEQELRRKRGEVVVVSCSGAEAVVGFWGKRERPRRSQ
uniref:Uncharacterized protein n=1 Tax=Arundo donax TaxID=35708 RepID=A0A0A9D979_ARUDO